MKKVKYITNKELLSEIDKSKQSFAYFEKPEHAKYDIILTDISEITNVQSNLIFRVMTNEHVPDGSNSGRKRRDDGKVKTPFEAYKHYIIANSVITEVGRSHWRGDLQTGEFCTEHGRMTHRLAMMLMLLVERYSKRGNVRNYSYIDEMCSHAHVQLAQVALQFEETKSYNPFAFYTQIIKNSFVRILNLEKKNQQIRDDLLIMAGVQPSFSKQLSDEAEQRNMGEPQPTKIREEKSKEPAKRGRKKKIIDPLVLETVI